MKDQYFGDVNDFRKYGLLRLLTRPDGLRLGVCWMLTEGDSRTDGRFLGYLDQPQRYRNRDPELFDWLQQVVGAERDRRTARIEASRLLGPAIFKSELLGDRQASPSAYFAECEGRFAGCDLVFFDPDNGLEIKSTRRGQRNSCKFLYWDEVCATFTTGASVLVYQHFIREAREGYTARMGAELQCRTMASAVFTFRTPHVLFLLAAQARHAAGFREQMGRAAALWAPDQIVPREHRMVEEARTEFVS